MTIVNQAHWDSWMGLMPMPENCEVETMYAMYDIIKLMDDKEYAAKQIQWYEGLWRQFMPKYQADIETYTDIMKLIKEGIQFWREELSE